ncbi:uncharacterized protein LOC106083693 [Stomoxys calcitrans]|uniref:uncharacterized protein LOC131995972 n=1 Tax=Stomoxys calcitrans TaxID=35570 RepID=UPI0027E37FA6|nr:uncharacterized protein LOC131995972 [Stomoxys calcitrans]XP_059221376.1 uncharacterized protein LOC106083693 [Stomoxys calcitrans]
MRFLLFIALVAVLVNSKVFALDCYQCGGDDCNDESTTQVITCPNTGDVFACYTMKYQDGDVTKKQKGCSVKSDTIAACSDVIIPEGTRNVVCEICTEPKCNSSPALALSMLLIPVVLFIRYIMN